MNGLQSNSNDRNPHGEQSTLRKRFSEQEDALLKSLVEEEGIRNWEEISKRMPFRTSRQCRDRYNNYLFKEIVNKPWTPEEDSIILEKYMIHGPHWVKISQYLEARSGNNVKNRWHKYLSKLKNTSIEKYGLMRNQASLPKVADSNATPQHQLQPLPNIETFSNPAPQKIPSISELQMVEGQMPVMSVPCSIDTFLQKASKT